VVQAILQACRAEGPPQKALRRQQTFCLCTCDQLTVHALVDFVTAVHCAYCPSLTMGATTEAQTLKGC
jgi:hypothetical protein